MNALTNVRNIQNLNLRELEAGVPFAQSWHQQYKDSAWIFIGGLDYDLTEGDIICLFSQYGEVANINLVRDKKTGKSKGFAFLCFENQLSTVLSVDNLNSIKLCGRTIRVDHVEEYKVPKMREDMAPEQQKLALEGCAPQPIAPSPNTSMSAEMEIEGSPDCSDRKKLKKRKEEKHNDIKGRVKEEPGMSSDQSFPKLTGSVVDGVLLPPRLLPPTLLPAPAIKGSKSKLKKSKKKKKDRKKQKKKNMEKKSRRDSSDSSSCSSSEEDGPTAATTTHQSKNADASQSDIRIKSEPPSDFETDSRWNNEIDHRDRWKNSSHLHSDRSRDPSSFKNERSLTRDSPCMSDGRRSNSHSLRDERRDEKICERRDDKYRSGVSEGRNRRDESQKSRRHFSDAEDEGSRIMHKRHKGNSDFYEKRD